LLREIAAPKLPSWHNNAAALFLMLHTLALGREVPISATN
jgi:hypothetical protein